MTGTRFVRQSTGTGSMQAKKIKLLVVRVGLGISKMELLKKNENFEICAPNLPEPIDDLQGGIEVNYFNDNFF